MKLKYELVCEISMQDLLTHPNYVLQKRPENTPLIKALRITFVSITPLSLRILW